MNRARLLWTAAALLALFVLLAAVVVPGWTLPFDRAVLAALREPGAPGVAAVPAWVVNGARGLSRIGDWEIRIVVALAIAAALVLRRRRVEAVALAAAWTGGALLLPLVKAAIGRARPELVWRLAEVEHASFPSGHAMGAAILYPMAGWLAGSLVHGGAARRRGLEAGVLLALAIGLSRVVLGVHWPSDVIGGWLLGAAWTLLCLGVARRGVRP